MPFKGFLAPHHDVGADCLQRIIFICKGGNAPTGRVIDHQFTPYRRVRRLQKGNGHTVGVVFHRQVLGTVSYHASRGVIDEVVCPGGIPCRVKGNRARNPVEPVGTIVIVVARHFNHLNHSTHRDIRRRYIARYDN